MIQTIIGPENNYRQMDAYLREKGIKTVLLVHGNSLYHLPVYQYFQELPERMGIRIVAFKEYSPNPLYQSVVRGVEVFHAEHCDSIIAVGGGSAMDVAKCIKLYSTMDPTVNYLRQRIVPNDIELLAIPTTAGTGSEATRYAVIYFEGEKQSVTDESCIPGAVLIDSSSLKTLPEYQKKSAMMDAFCHALESFWSINSTQESKELSKKCLRLLLANMDAYLAHDDRANREMLLAANLGGRAINITQTTAGHAMCYKITGLWGVAHGHAAALVNRRLWPWMIRSTDRCVDPRGRKYLENVFEEIAEAMGCGSAQSAAERFGKLLDELGLSIPTAGRKDYEALKHSVNPDRLKNNPVALDLETIDKLYHEILR